MNSLDIARVFRPQGFLSYRPGYEHRASQVDMALSLFENEGHAMVEAPTGSGKTLAYLVPAAAHAQASGLPTVISTTTVALQEQLEREAQVIKPLFPGLNTAVFKGRGHYLCPIRLRNQLRQSKDPRLTGSYQQIAAWYNRGQSDRSTLPAHLQHLWSTVDAGSCRGRRCGDCPARAAHAVARVANLIFANHALLAVDAKTQRLLPGYDELVVDEGHRLEEVTTEALSASFVLGEEPECFAQARAAGLANSHGLYVLQLLRRADELAELREEPRLIHVNREWLEVCQGWQQLRPSLQQLLQSIDDRDPSDSTRLEALGQASHGLEQLIDRLDRFFSDTDDVRWIERGRAHFAPIEVSGWLRQRLWPKRAAVVSATLRRLDGFDRDQLGLGAGPDLLLPPVFDYRRQALLCTPDFLDPDDPDYDDMTAEILAGLFDVLGGAIMCLFTSHRSLQAAGDRLRRAGVPCLEQGRDGERSQLVDQFKQGGTILLGAATFWEGVDLVGDYLKGLVIARLPFDVPSDPVHRARAALYQNPFRDYTLDRAVMKIRQGFGRLIRTKQDHGVCVILDSRIRRKGYGRTVLRALPACETYSGDDIEGRTARWFAQDKELSA